MNQMVVAVFANEGAALDGLRELRDLHGEGGVSLYASAVILKDKKSKVSVRQPAVQGPAGIVLGTIAGGLVGALGGPPAAPLGAYLVGLLFDLGKFGVDLGFFHDVSKALTAGKAAVLAEVEESWTSLLDERLGKHGGTVHRRFRVDMADDQLIRKSAALKANLNALQHELGHAIAKDKAGIQKDIEQVKMQIRATQTQAKAKLEEAKAQMNARIKVLQGQAKKATGQTEARIDKRIAEVRADFEGRSNKLSQALVKIKSAD